MNCRRYTRYPFNLPLRTTLYLLLLLPIVHVEAKSQLRDISYPEAKSAIDTYRADLPSDLAGLSPANVQLNWSNWVRSRDSEVRTRLIRGEEDTLTNLLRYGVTFTEQPRIDWPMLFQYGHDQFVSTTAQNRASDLIKGLLSPGKNEHLLIMRDFVISRGYSLTTAPERATLREYLLNNLGRMQSEYLSYLEERKKYESGPRDEGKWLELNSHLYAARGISLDTDIRPNFSVDSALVSLSSHATISAKSIRRVAIVGPGLDFVNKDNGTDLYPPQTTQPFAVMDSLLRLGLADPTHLRVVTYDISPSVNRHLANARKRARQGIPYHMQVPLDESQGMGPALNQYWENFGEKIGSPTTPIQLSNSALNVKLRALNIKPEIVTRVEPVDMNVVFQYQILPPAEKYDLIIGTNIFVYYSAFEQSLALANLARMLRPSGLLISNNLLSGTPDSQLREVARVKVVNGRSVSETLFVYQKK